MKIVVLAVLMIVGVTQDLVFSETKAEPWDRQFLRGFLSEAKAQGWRVRPLSLTKDRGIKALATQMPECNDTLFFLPMVTGGEFLGVVERFGQSLDMPATYYFDGRTHQVFPTVQFWSKRTLNSALPLFESEMGDEVAVAAFVPKRCSQALQILTRRFDQVLYSDNAVAQISVLTE